MTLTFGSLFAGIGGIDLGFERAGMRCVWQVEHHPHAIRVLEKHWPRLPRYDDVKAFYWSRAAYEGFEFPNLICGGPPCQRTSNAAAIQGKKTGETLWPEMYRIIATACHQPEWIVVEQPVGNRKWEAKVTADLERAGYHFARLQLEASGSGAPHRRRRVFFVANPLQERCEKVARFAVASPVEKSSWPAPPRGTWRTSGAGNHRMDDGVSDWMDRLERLGDSVVPQTAEFVGRCIVAASGD